MEIPLLLSSCAIGGVLIFFARSHAWIERWTLVWSSAVLVQGVYLGVRAVSEAQSLSQGIQWNLDPASGLLIALISFMQWTAVLASMPYIRNELEHGVINLSQVRRYALLLPLFVLAMSAATLSNNLGVVWIALEATTLATTFLVGLYERPGSLEAAWKYLILCSTGIALGLIGVLILFYAAQSAGAGTESTAIYWSVLHQHAHVLSPLLVQLAFVLILIGYGTKAGIVPMHTWLPDAHSSAPSPVSGLLSGVLLPVALLAVLRIKSITDLSMGGSSWSSSVLLVFGVLTCVVSAAFILRQYDYKRLLAYSSIEHMGLILFSFALGGVAAVAGVIHLAAHALIKSALFFGAGNIVVRFKSTKFRYVGNVSSILPITGILFALGVLMLLATPPSPLFYSELLVVSQGIVTAPIATTFVLLAMVVIAAGFIKQCMPLLFSRPEEVIPAKPGEVWTIGHLGISFHLALLAVFGIAVWTPIGFSIASRIALAFM